MVVFEATIPARRLFVAQSNAMAVASTEGEAMRIVSSTSPRLNRFARHPIPSPSREAKKRLGWMEHYEKCGNASLTCRYFGISREPFYRWKRRYNPRDLSTLEDRSSLPGKRRSRTWTVEPVEAVRRVREPYPRWGKDKLRVILERENVCLSVSMVGRILNYLKARGVLREPLRAIKTRQRRWKRPYRPYGVRKPKDYRIEAPGDLVQLDTLEVRPEPGVVLKQFTSRDVVSRWDCLELACRATATTASRLLDPILERIPFK